MKKAEQVILIGFMGSGKSSIGIKLSYRLKRTLLDTDKQIERKQGKSISEIFAQDGETAFRQMETAYLQELLSTGEQQIISTGGGTPLREENRALLKQLGVVFYLQVSPETVYERLKGDTTRPLLRTKNPMERITELLESRKALYEAAADYVISVDGKSLEDIVEEIANYMEEKR